MGGDRETRGISTACPLLAPSPRLYGKGERGDEVAQRQGGGAEGGLRGEAFILVLTGDKENPTSNLQPPVPLPYALRLYVSRIKHSILEPNRSPAQGV